MDRHLVGGRAGRARGENFHVARRLIAGPGLDPVAIDLHGGVQRLHAHMRNVLREEVRGEHLGGALDGRGGVALVEHLDAGLVPVGRDCNVILQDLLVRIGLR